MREFNRYDDPISDPGVEDSIGRADPDIAAKDGGERAAAVTRRREENELANIAQANGVDRDEARRIRRTVVKDGGHAAVINAVRTYAVDSAEMEDGPVY